MYRCLRYGMFMTRFWKGIKSHQYNYVIVRIHIFYIRMHIYLTVVWGIFSIRKLLCKPTNCFIIELIEKVKAFNFKS